MVYGMLYILVVHGMCVYIYILIRIHNMNRRILHPVS